MMSTQHVANEKDHRSDGNNAHHWPQSLRLREGDAAIESQCETQCPHNVDGVTIVEG